MFLTIVNPLFASDGKVDLAFDAGQIVPLFDAGVNQAYYIIDTELQDNGQILVSGAFTSINEINRSNLARLNIDGSLDINFVPSINAPPLIIEIQEDNKIVIAGHFTEVNGESRANLARLNRDGSLDESFSPNLNLQSSISLNRLSTMAIQLDGKILIGGRFDHLDASRKNLVRLHADGSVDTSFVSELGLSSVESIALQTDGKIVVTQSTRSVHTGAGNEALERLNPNGSLDQNFNLTQRIGTLNPIAIQRDGKILVGYGGGIIRFNTNGSTDNMFDNPNINYFVDEIIVQPDNKILVGGFFSTVGGVNRNGVARLNQNGSLDRSFLAGGINGNGVRSISLISSDAILVGGRFESIGGGNRSNIAKLRITQSQDDELCFPITSTSNSLSLVCL